MDSNGAIPSANIFLLTFSFTLVAVLGAYCYQRYKRSKNQPPTQWEPVGNVTELGIYPLKSGKRIPVRRAQVTKYGLKQTIQDETAYQMRDRELVVYKPHSLEFTTARTYPKMVLIETNVHDENHLAFDAPGMRTLYVKIPVPDEATENYITCWKNEKIRSLDCGDEAASWFSRYILEKESGFRLGYHPGSYTRDIEKANKKYLKFYTNLTNDSGGLFSDLASCLIVNQKTVAHLNTKIEDSNVTAHNFRPNIVVDCDPYAEDGWDWLKVGDVVFRVIKPCTRCILTTIDPITGVRNQNGEPLKTLKMYRQIPNEELRKLEQNSPVMGVNVGAKRLGVVSVGDTIYVGKGL